MTFDLVKQAESLLSPFAPWPKARARIHRRDIMSPDICYCFDDQELNEVAAYMPDVKVRRLPVVNSDKRLVGIVSLGDIALADDPRQNAATALCGVDSEHSQGNGRVYAGVIFPCVLHGDGSFPSGPGLSAFDARGENGEQRSWRVL